MRKQMIGPLVVLAMLTGLVLASCGSTTAQQSATPSPPTETPADEEASGENGETPVAEETTRTSNGNNGDNGENGDGDMSRSENGVVQVLHSEQPREAAPEASESDVTALVDANSRFAFDLYQTMRKQEGNLFFSPYSISAALAMAYGGARGETAEQMKTTLHITLPPEQFHAAFNRLDQQLVAEAGGAGEAGEANDDRTFRLNIANSLWGQKDYPFEPDFLNLLARNYGAGLRLANFAEQPDVARQAINEWVSDQTQGKIEDLIPPGAINNLTRLVLANAIYFKADWAYPFKKESTHEDEFTLLDSSVITVEMMAQTEHLRYGVGEGYQTAILPYVGGAEMMLLVPDAGTFGAFEEGLNVEQIQEIEAAMEERRVNLMLPKFTFRHSQSLNDILTSLGMTDAFDPSKADFSDMDGTRELFLSQAIHKAFVAVDEKGTEAAAATALTMGVTSAEDMEPPVSLKIDRPFVFLIRDGETGTVLFAGRVVSPR